MTTTVYRGVAYQLRLIERDDNVNLVCMNDDCKGLETDIPWDELDDDAFDETDEADYITTISRVAFDGQWVPATRIDPAWPKRDYCPDCGSSEVVAI